MTYSSHGVPTATRDIYREAIDEALKRSIPLHFSAGMAGAVAGRRSQFASSRTRRLREKRPSAHGFSIRSAAATEPSKSTGAWGCGRCDEVGSFGSVHNRSADHN